MTAPALSLGAALLAALDDETISHLAQRLRPHLRDDGSAGLLTPAEAAERLRLHPKTVVRMAREGRLPAVKVGTGWRFHPDRLTVEPRTPPPTTRVGHSRPRARSGGVPASVHAIRGEGAG
jgi:excisionase family DNA binding protein